MNPVLPPLRPIDLTANSPVSSYMKSMAMVCPFIEPSARAGLLFGCVVSPDCQTNEDIHPRLFEQLVPQIERFRDTRRALPEKQQRLLVCHTVVIHMPTDLDVETAQQLTWPNWLGWSLKQLYTPKEIVFGFVRKNVVEKSSFGTAVPVAPFHAVVIRSRVANSDGRFFKGNEPLLQAMMEADDDGQNAHAVVPGPVPDIRDPQVLRESRYFQTVRQWGQSLLGKK